jgi:hypothetical protein
VKNLLKAIDIATTGEYRDAQGRLVAEASGTDAFFKGLGFQPAHIAEFQRQREGLQQDVNLQRVKEDALADLWARGRVEKDPALVREARQRLADWNRTHPEAPIRIDRRQLVSRVRNLRRTARERMRRATPREMRPSY